MKIMFNNEINIPMKTTMITNILSKFDKRSKHSNHGKANIKASPREVTDFYTNNKYILDVIARFATHLYNISSDRLIPASHIGALIYLSGYEEDNKMSEFMYEFMTENPTLSYSNIAKKVAVLYREEKIKKLKGKTSIEIRVKRNYIISTEKQLYRRNQTRAHIRGKKYEVASFSEHNPREEDPQYINLNFIESINEEIREKNEK